jgi:hypothetical protein
MSWFDRLHARRRQGGRRRAGQVQNTLDRAATAADLAHLREFATSRTGVEFYVEPETTATDTTAVAVAADGEWTRRRVGTPAAIARLARDLRLPLYQAAVVGYPRRMREYNTRRRADPASPPPSPGSQ